MGSVNIVSYAAGADTGGQSYRLHQAFTKLTDHTFHSLVRSTNYLRYPKHVGWEARGRLLAQADLVHAHSHFRTLEEVDKPMIIQYHGTQFRNNPKTYIRAAQARHARQFVSTLDLWLLGPKQLTWLPAPYDLDWLATFRKPQDGKLRIGHAPTDRAVKSTKALIAAAERLNKTTKVELVMIERQPWDKCLRLKGTIDVLFDQVILGYGNNAIEAWGMGIPVICGAQPDTLHEMRNRFGELPFYEATEDTIYEALSAMADDVTRKEFGERGYLHAERFHSDRAVVELLEPAYREAIDSHRSNPPPPPPRVRRGPARRRR